MPRIDGTLDIECAGWSRMVLGVVHSPMKGTRVVRTPDELADELLRRGGWYWAWNGGRYDFLCILDVFHRRGMKVTCTMSGSTITRARIGKLVLVDAYHLCPMSLYRAAGIVGEAGIEIDLPCVCDERSADTPRGCGGYCQITPRMAPEVRRHVEQYCIAQTVQTYRILCALSDHCAAEGYELRGTLGGTAWATANFFNDTATTEMRSTTWNRLRSAYYGGRTVAARARAERVWWWDIVNAYPAALSRPVPIGHPYEMGRRAARAAFCHDRPGIYRATVYVEERYLPPLPWRFSGRVSYPFGQLTGAWTQPELAHAEAHGATVLDIHGAVVFEREAPLFAPVMRAWFETRRRVGKGTALGHWQSQLAKAITGKLAEVPERQQVLIHPGSVVLCAPWLAHSRRNGCTRHHCTGRCGAYRQLDRWGTIWSAPFWRRGDSSHVQWAAYTTAGTRIDWLDAAETCDVDLCYGDTDSIVRRARMVTVDAQAQGELALEAPATSWRDSAPGKVGEDLGDFEFQGESFDWHCKGLKNYRHVRDGQAIVRAAGIPHATDREWKALDAQTADLVEERRGVMSLKQAALTGNGLFQRRYNPITPRHTEGWYGDRLLSTDGRTYAVSRGQIEEKIRRAHRRGGIDLGAVGQSACTPSTQPGDVAPQGAKESSPHR